MITCSRKIEFDYGHRVMNHESKCANCHGHRGVVEVVATSDELDGIGRVIDFSVLKQIVGGWIDENWDHTMILFEQDAEAIELLNRIQKNKPVFVAPFNPTAENMANYLLHTICPELLKGTGISVVRVIMWETPNCKAEAYV